MERNDRLFIVIGALLSLCAWSIVYLVSGASTGLVFFAAPFVIVLQWASSLSVLHLLQAITFVLSLPFIVVGLLMIRRDRKRKT